MRRNHNIWRMRAAWMIRNRGEYRVVSRGSDNGLVIRCSGDFPKVTLSRSPAENRTRRFIRRVNLILNGIDRVTFKDGTSVGYPRVFRFQPLAWRPVRGMTQHAMTFDVAWESKRFPG